MAEAASAGWLEGARPALTMVLVQLLIAGMILLSKLVLNRGLFPWALVLYRNAIGALVMAPLAFIFERKSCKKLGLVPLFLMFLNASFGLTMALGMYYYGLRDTTASYSSSFLNLIPIVTFFLSVIARMETLGLNNNAGRAKVSGALICIGGALTVTLYKGIRLHLWPTLVHTNSTLVSDSSGRNWIRGSLLLTGSSFCYGVWYLLQVKQFQVYPFTYSTTMFVCVIGCVEDGVIGLLVDRKPSSWRLGWNLQLLTVVYSGVFNSGIVLCLIGWVVRQCGPTYPSMFGPLSLLFTTMFESLCMGQDVTVGSLLGMLLIIGGLYAFLWGKKKEIQVRSNGHMTLLTSSVNVERKNRMDVRHSEHVQHTDARVPAV